MKSTLFQLVTLILLVLHSSTVLGSKNSDFTLSNAEQVRFTENALKSDASNDQNKRLSFYAYGASFDLVLQQDKQLMRRLSSSRPDMKLYAGKLEGKADSWARITVIEDQYSGAIFDGEELFIIDTGDNINDALAGRAAMQDVKTVIYKASELSSDSQCGSDAEHQTSFSYNSILPDEALGSNSSNVDVSDIEVATTTALQQINLRIVVDSLYVSSSNLDAEAQVISQMNIVDAIFTEQIDVRFGITGIEILSDNNILTSTDAETLLNQFRTFIGSNNPGLSHFFTGRDINGSTIGIAFLNSICRSTGVGLTQAGGRGTLGALTAAHEFGHNFGAPHDNQVGSACVDSPGTFLMNPSLNGSDEFSECSVQQILGTLTNAQCLVPVVAETPEVPETPEPASSCDFAIDFSEGDNDFQFVADQESPLYSFSSVANGSVNIFLGGVDAEDIFDIEGVWLRECLSQDGGSITYNVNASLSQSTQYEANEFSQIGLRINGVTTVLDTLIGDGNGGLVEPTTGLQQYTVETQLNAGLNTIELVCFNNAKTFSDETTECRFNQLNRVQPSEEFCLPIRTDNGNLAVICL